MSFTTIADLETRLAERLDPIDGSVTRAPRLDDEAREQIGRVFTPAAVLAPIVRRADGWTMLLTQRTETMPTHAGQIAFPGGRVQPEDEGPVATALRETEEEIGLARAFVRPIGRLEAYATGSGYEITPIIAYVEPGFHLVIDPREVHDAFETPLAFLFDPMNHRIGQAEYRGALRSFYEMAHNNRRIWGATAGMIRGLYERLYGDEDRT